MEFDISWIFFLFILIYFLSKIWKDTKVSRKMRKHFKWELNEIMTDDKYKVKGKQ